MHCKKATICQASKNLKQYMELIEKVARIEFSKLSSSHVVEFTDLVNIGAITVHYLIEENPDGEYNDSYLSTAIKWAIRNELRRKYKWYSLKSKEDVSETNQLEIRESIYKTILSINELAERENPIQIKDDNLTPDEDFEFKEMSILLKEAIEKLPEREKNIIESRFYKDRKIKDIAEDFNVSPSRITRIIQTSLNKIKKELQKQEIAS